MVTWNRVILEYIPYKDFSCYNQANKKRTKRFFLFKELMTDMEMTSPALTPKLKRLANRMRELIDEGKAVALLERSSAHGPKYIQDKATLHSWLSKVTNIIEASFGAESSQSRHLSQLMPRGIQLVKYASEVLSIVGLLSGAVEDLEKGYLLKQEFLIAGEVFDSLLEQAKYLNQTGYQGPAAVLGRVVLEGALRRIARREGMESDEKASTINESLKSASIYTQPRWRMVQAWLDIGNAAAHGRVSDFTDRDVTEMLEGISNFLATDF